MKKRNVLPIIECSGTEYEIGRQYGEQARKNLQRSVALMLSSMKHMPYQAERAAVIRASQRYLNNVRAFDPEAMERVRGMSEGSAIPFDEIFALQCYSELFVNYPGLSGMCTSFGVTGPAAKNGATILGQNVDWHPDATIDLVRIRHADGSRMLGLFLCGYNAYYLTSHGIGNCANMTLCPSASVTEHVPFAFYLYAAMRRRNAGEAMDILRETSRGVGYIHIADKSGFLSGIESVYDDHTVIEPKAGMLVHGNHYETDKYKKTDGAYVYIQDSFHRANRLRALIAKSYGSITPETMMEFLEDHEGRPQSICRHVDLEKPDVFATMSLCSFIMIPGEGRMLISNGPPCENEYVEYQV
jgi:isopenicillin-N N-acyltransferase-like protein